MKSREEKAIELLKRYLNGEGIDHKSVCNFYETWKDDFTCTCGHDEFVEEVRELLKTNLEKSLT